MTNNFTSKVSKLAKDAAFVCKKNAPGILIVTGVCGVVASTVLACKATLDSKDIVEETRKDIHNLDVAAVAAGIKEADESFTEEDIKVAEIAAEKHEIQAMTAETLRRDVAVVYTRTALKFLKLYGPAVLVGAASIAAILTSHKILTKRNAAIASAFVAVNEGFKDYRKRVVDRFGEKVDKELRYNVQPTVVEEIVTDKKGNEKTVETTINAATKPDHNEFTRCFDESCEGWTKDPEYNRMFLENIQRQANDRLENEGRLFLNDVYEMLGFDKTREGQVVGWVLNNKNNEFSDGYIDFGIYSDINDNAKRRFVNGLERSIFLEFNVDGPILDSF